MKAIYWTLEAERWLQEIHDYISRDNPPAATRVIEGIFTKVETLREFPHIGYVYGKVDEGLIRVVLYGHYRIVYLLRDADEIDILGVFHAAMEMDRYLPKLDYGKKK